MPSSEPNPTLPEHSACLAESPWISHAKSVVGHVRRANEDAFLDGRELGLWVVADGMGGHSRGDRASQSIIERLQTFRPGGDADADLSHLTALLQEANRFCRTEAGGQVMGSTVAVLLVSGLNVFLVWAGDSRIYRVRDGETRQLTDDHSLVQELYRLGELTEDEAESHPSSNVITRAVGVNDELDLQVRQVDLRPGDRYLLCSDGLFKDMTRDELTDLLQLASPQHALDEMVNLALKRGGGDNITAIVVQFRYTRG